jgi:hypothetical protein
VWTYLIYGWVRAVQDYRGINQRVWEYFESVYGGGPVLIRAALDIYTPSLTPSPAPAPAPAPTSVASEGGTASSAGKSKKKRARAGTDAASSPNPTPPVAADTASTVSSDSPTGAPVDPVPQEAAATPDPDNTEQASDAA